MSWINWKGITTEDKGLIVTRMPNIQRAKARVEEITIPGRSGALHVWDGSYEPITMNATLNAFDSAHFGELSEWLNGDGELILSDDPTKCWHGRIIQAVPFSRHRACGIFDEISITWTCDPFKHESTPQTIELSEGANTIINIGDVPALPLITIDGTGDITLTTSKGMITVTGAENPVTLDCAAKLAYWNTDPITSANEAVSIDAWPVIDGALEITVPAGVAVTVTPRWRWL